MFMDYYIYNSVSRSGECVFSKCMDEWLCGIWNLMLRWLEVIHLDGDRVGGRIAGQIDVVPLGVKVLLAVGRLEGQAQGCSASGTVGYVEGNRH